MDDCIEAYYARERGEVDVHEYYQILKNNGITEEQVDTELNAQWFSDAHKDLYGVRPNLASMARYRGLSVEEQVAEATWISKRAYDDA